MTGALVLCAIVNTAAAVAGIASARELTCANVFGDHMVLQRDGRTKVWGVADAGERIRVAFRGKTAEATADAHGAWSTTLEVGGASCEPAEFTVTGAKKTLVFRDVLVGDVWVAGGQSNMHFMLQSDRNGSNEVAHAANETLVRFYEAKRSSRRTVQAENPGEWQRATPETAGRFSAVAWYFAKEIAASQKIPVGILNLNSGCTRMQSWMSMDEIRRHPTEYAELIHEYDAEVCKLAAYPDPGRQAVSKGWEDARLADTNGWRAANVGGYLEKDYGKVDGVFWYRREFVLPADAPADGLVFQFKADDFDRAWCDGQPVGQTGEETEEYWEHLRRYPLKGLRPGRHVLAVRVHDQHYAGGLFGDIAVTGPGGYKLPLTDGWLTRCEILAPDRHITADSETHMPSYYWNSMIAPTLGYRARGTIWYQGCCNATYTNGINRMIFRDLLASWRRDRFGFAGSPFYMTQLTVYRPDNWPLFRSEQFAAATTLPRSDIVCTLDVGDLDDIHPTNKQPVGHRLALLARHHDYGEKGLEFSGPRFAGLERVTGGVRVKFTHAKGLKTTDGRAPAAFRAYGSAGQELSVSAKIVGETVELTASEPIVKVAYAHEQCPTVNLVNAEHLPAFPFVAL